MAAHGAEPAHENDEASKGDEAQASVDTEELVSLRTVRECRKYKNRYYKPADERCLIQ